MNGTESYENRYTTLINNVLIGKGDIVKGYYYYISNRISYSTCYNYINHIIKLYEYTGKEYDKLTIDDYAIYLASLKRRTSGYQRCAYFALKRLSEYLVYSGRTSEDIMSHIPAPKNIETIETKQKREIGFLTKEETRIFLETAKQGIGNEKALSYQTKWKERDLAILYVLLSTGMRCSALYKLDVNNIDWDNKMIITFDKGGKVNKYNLPQEVTEVLNKWISKREKVLNGRTETALFISNRRTRLTTAAISLMVKKYSANIKGKHITPHKLRATYGTQLYNETRDIKFVQDRMMHSNPKTTELYIRGNEDADRQKASDIISKFLSD